MKKQAVQFKVGKDILRGLIFIPDSQGPFPAIISFHGSGGKGEKYYEWAERFVKEGYLVFAFNFRGCGKSDGNYLVQKYEDALKDAETAFKLLLKQKDVNVNKIGLVGGSFGGFLASMLCLKLKIKSLILLAPSAHADKLTLRIDRGNLGEEVKYFLDKKNWLDSPSYKKISQFTNPVLIIKSEYDENIPSDVVDRYYEQAFNSEKKEMKIIKGANHRLSDQWMRNEAFELMSDWFLETL